MWSIEDVHSRSFEFLLKHHYDFKAEGLEFLFRTRSRYLKGKEKYWFLGNERYAAISFWTGQDTFNKTPNVYINIGTSGAISLQMSAKDNKSKQQYLSRLIEQLEGVSQISEGYWEKVYSTKFDRDYIAVLREFLEEEKITIDRYIRSNPYQEGIPTVVPGDDDGEFNNPQHELSFIDETDFYQMLLATFQERNVSKSTSFEQNSALPMSIKSLEVINFKGIEHLRIENIPTDANWIVLTGENGFGKSSVLQSIAIGAAGPSERYFGLIGDKSLVVLETSHDSRNYVNVLFDSPSSKRVGRLDLATYGSSRLTVSKDSGEQWRNAVYNLFNVDGNLINIEYELIETNAYYKNKFSLFKEAFCTLIPEIKDIRIDNSGERPQVKYIEQDNAGNAYNEVRFEDLAAGFRSTIAMIGDMISRLMNKRRQYRALNELEGIVVIDEIELHLHPKCQKKFPETLTALFPKVQFIASTHSPLPLLGMPKKTVLLRVDRSKHSGITVRRLHKLESEIHELLPDTILSSSIFNFDYLETLTEEEFKRIPLTSNYDEIERMKEVDDRLSKVDKNIFPDELFTEE